MRLFEDSMETVLWIRRMLDSGEINIRWLPANSIRPPASAEASARVRDCNFSDRRSMTPADGDDQRRIDQSASAAESEDEFGESDFIVQIFKSPRIIRMNVLLDVNKSMNLGTKGMLKSVLAALCAGAGIKSAQESNDQAGFVTYTHQPVSSFKAQNPRRLLTPALIKAVEDRDFVEDETAPFNWRQWLPGARQSLTSEAPSEGGGLEKALQMVQRKTKNVVLVVSDFANMNEDDWEALRISGIQHDTIVVFVQDRRERELPKAPWPGMQYTLEDFRGETKSFWVAPDNAPQWYLKQMRRILGFSHHAARVRGKLGAPRGSHPRTLSRMRCQPCDREH